MQNKKQLSEEDLTRIQGGATDWRLFSAKFIQYMSTYSGVITNEHKELIQAIKNKNEAQIAILAIPLAAKYPDIAMILLECK